MSGRKKGRERKTWGEGRGIEEWEEEEDRARRNDEAKGRKEARERKTLVEGTEEGWEQEEDMM